MNQSLELVTHISGGHPAIVAGAWQLCHVCVSRMAHLSGLGQRLTGSFAHVGAAGQERKEVPFASHTACTIEMTNLHRRVDVAVIDEIQVSLHGHPMLSCRSPFAVWQLQGGGVGNGWLVDTR